MSLFSPRILLFDIDGTLLRVCHNKAIEVVRETFLQIFSADPFAGGNIFSFGGKTDLLIFCELGAAVGIPEREILRYSLRIGEVLNCHFSQAVSSREVTLLQGVVPLLEAIERKKFAFSALVTGNVKGVAIQKIRLARLENYFIGGAFGCDHKERSKLPPLAIKRINDFIGTPLFSSKTAIIIGDTPYDILCAKSNGIKSVAVATGGYSQEELADYKPDMLVPNFTALIQQWDDFIAV